MYNPIVFLPSSEIMTQENKRRRRRRNKKPEKLEQNHAKLPLPCSSFSTRSVQVSEKKFKRRKNKKQKNLLLLSNNSTLNQEEEKLAHQNGQTQKQGDQQISKSAKKSSSLLDKMRARLSGGHFRMLNEKLYTCSGHEAFQFFRNDPSLFNVYHSGYQEQMSHWPQQPLNIIVKWLKDHSPSLKVADFGCGDARLAKSVPNKVYSIDLVSSDPSVISCDMAHTPLEASSVDVAVFCLSLMGTDFSDYLKEAYRVLRPRGWLLIAEVKSRFDPSNGGADPNKFIEALQGLGLKNIFKDFSNKMFLLFYFQKCKEQIHGAVQIDWPTLKPCIYKRR